jgi:EAL domain-containing protein (putative c-di-GMP-specific phosphodiesterase class I)
MTAYSLSNATGSALEPLFAQLERDHFPASRFSEPCPGAVAARFFQSRLTSAFQPIVRAADGSIAGHHALLRVFAESGAAVAPWSLFAQDSSDALLVQLDRLTRTLHALNYLRHADGERLLFLNVDARLLSIIAEGHGAYFALILGLVGISPAQVALVLPAGALDDPASFVRAAITYRFRGYRIVAQLHSDATADLEHVFLADPHFVALDAPLAARSDATHRIVAALAHRGIHALARRIEDEEQAQAARDAGFGFLQGAHFDSSTEASRDTATNDPR